LLPIVEAPVNQAEKGAENMQMRDDCGRSAAASKKKFHPSQKLLCCFGATPYFRAGHHLNTSIMKPESKKQPAISNLHFIHN
jgi:hypothetical protein